MSGHFLWAMCRGGGSWKESGAWVHLRMLNFHWIKIHMRAVLCCTQPRSICDMRTIHSRNNEGKAFKRVLINDQTHNGQFKKEKKKRLKSMQRNWDIVFCFPSCGTKPGAYITHNLQGYKTEESSNSVSDKGGEVKTSKSDAACFPSFLCSIFLADKKRAQKPISWSRRRTTFIE